MMYVDELQDYPDCRLPYKRWCHLATDGTLEALHAFAARLGLQRRWFQGQATHPHDDLVPSKRAHALRLGAKAVTSTELIARCSPRLTALGRSVASQLVAASSADKQTLSQEQEDPYSHGTHDD